ncbi:DUF441 family protein, partial [Mesorhizobium sp. M00.F.Ca.ET.186.01.1.1]
MLLPCLISFFVCGNTSGHNPIGILAPLASGKVNPASVLALFTHWHTILAILMGVFVACLAGKGTGLMSGNPLRKPPPGARCNSISK